MGGSEVFEKLIEKKLLKIIKVFLSEPNKEFYLQELSESSNVPVASAFRILNKLIDYKLVSERKISRFSLYKLTNNDETSFLATIFKPEIDPLREFIHRITAKFDVLEIFQQGAKSENKSNLIILAYDVDNGFLNQLAKEIKVQYNYLINFMILTPEQFEQMEKMGFYKEAKQKLYER